jgi:NAD(P)-dependent dehydrogenase (short-subunit alcohol dehydrogenase family)
MPDPHGVQIKEAVAMSSSVVLITGALTGIGRAAAVSLRKKGHTLLCLGVETNKDKS